MNTVFRKVILVIMLLGIMVPSSAGAQVGLGSSQTLTPSAQSNTAYAPEDVFTITVLHTNDFHGQLEPSGSNPGIARLATKINSIRTAVGADNTLLVDAGDEMQGSLLSNLQKGKPVIDLFSFLGYDAATFGNHEFDWALSYLTERVDEAKPVYPYVSANIVAQGAAATCAAAGWTSPDFVTPWITTTVGTGADTVVVGITGVTTLETPTITLAGNTDGLCFKDPADSIAHYYDAMQAAGAKAIIVLSHLGMKDGGYGYGLTVYGDETLASKMTTLGKPVNLIIGGHSHTNLATTFPTGVKVGSTTIATAHYNGRQLGQASLVFDKTTKSLVDLTWKTNLIGTGDAEDGPTKTRLLTWVNDPTYQSLINQQIGFTNVSLTLGNKYWADSVMADFIDDSIYNYLNGDAIVENDIDLFLNNPGGLRADIVVTGTLPYTLTYGSMFTVLPFGNATVVGEMTGGQILEVINQGFENAPGSVKAIQPAGLRYKYYYYTDSNPGPQPWAWGGFDVTVYNRTTDTWEPLEIDRVYKVGTNEFLAPAGGDGFNGFRYMKNVTYWGDMLNAVNAYVTANYGTPATAYNGPVPATPGLPDGRLMREGNDTSGAIVPITLLSVNDTHGRLISSSAADATRLATIVNQERAHNTSRTLLVHAGDLMQGDAMSYFFRTAGLGYSSDGTPLATALQINPNIAVLNAMNFDAMVLGNHEFNFGSEVFTSTFKDADFAILGANISDTGAYGLDEVDVLPYKQFILGAEEIKIALLGISNHRVPNYELPSNIPGLLFANPITTAQAQTAALAAANDAIVALTHIGFADDPKSVEVDANVDTNLAAQVAFLDAIIGSHSHTSPVLNNSTIPAPYKYLPAIIGGPDNTPVLINQSNRYWNFLGETILGMRLNAGTGSYEVVARAARNIPITSATPQDAVIKAVVDPYAALQTAYSNTEIGTTTVPLDAQAAYTQETNGANLQADASVWALKDKGIAVDIHLSGAMTNSKVAATATITDPVTLKISDMFTSMPYENSLLVISMNGPQIKAVLERAYRNYYYYKYVPGYGGYSYYTTCMLDTDSMGEITYVDRSPSLPDGNNVYSFKIGDSLVDFTDATKYYNVSTVNYLAAGSCNFNNSGVSLWPLDQIVADTQYYVRDVVIDYIKERGGVPADEIAVGSRLFFLPVGPSVASFRADLRQGYSGLMVTFTNNSRGDFDTCTWDFGDGSTSSSCAQTVTHTYQAVGKYTVTLTISGTGGTDEFSQTDYIQIDYRKVFFPWVPQR